MQSIRTQRSECTNGENSKDEQSSQSVLNFYTADRNNYNFIFPLLDWQTINDITVEHDIPLELCNSGGFKEIKLPFVDVTDSQYGLAMMDIISHDLTVKRSWYFYDDAVTALASNLTLRTSTTPRSTLTSRLLPIGKITIGFFNSTIVTLNDGTYSFPYEQGKTSNVQWLHIGDSNIGYVLQLQQQYNSVGVQFGTKTGNYIDIGPFNRTVTARMVTLYIDHGRGSYSNLDYNYMILPNVTLESMPTLIKKYDEEQVFACTVTKGIFHGTM